MILKFLATLLVAVATALVAGIVAVYTIAVIFEFDDEKFMADAKEGILFGILFLASSLFWLLTL